MRVEFPEESKPLPKGTIKSFLKENRKRVFSSFFLSLMMILVVLYFIWTKQNRFKGLSQSFYFQKAIQEGQKGVDMESLLLFVKTHPDFEPNFSSYLEEKFVLSHDLKKAEEIFLQTRSRLDTLLPYHEEYAFISLLIDNNKLKEAYNRSSSLMQTLVTMNLKECFYRLYLFNLFRMGILEKKLQEETKSFALLEALLKDMSHQGEEKREFISHFSSKNISFFDYLKKIL